jgi:exodeoxyribonuclease V alpha subunit
MMSLQCDAVLAEFDNCVELGLLRRLSHAFARFIASLDTTPPALAVSCALLSELESRGHSCLMLAELSHDAPGLLGWTNEQWQSVCVAAGKLPSSVEDWQLALALCAQVWVVGKPDEQQPLVLDGDRLYLRRYWRHEQRVAQAINARAAAGGGVGAAAGVGAGREVDPAQVREWLDRLFDGAPGKGPDWQKIACAVAARSTFSIITGGPGTGKTYTVARLLALLFGLSPSPERLRIALAAPTGKAAARLKQSIDSALGELAARVEDILPLDRLAARMAPAGTLHSLLGARPDTRAVRHNAGNPLDIDVLIVDEASMIHLEMMSMLLDALPPRATVILLGDKDQLASVEAGAVMGDLCFGAQDGGYDKDTAAYVLQASGEPLPDAMLGKGSGSSRLAQSTVMLRESRRFGGPIGQLAMSVNAGDAAGAARCLRASEDGIVQWKEHATPADILPLALDGRPGAEGGYRTYLQLLASPVLATSADNNAYLDWVRSVLKAFDGFRILCAVREGEWGVAGVNQAIERHLEQEGLIRRRSEWYAGRPVMVTRNDYSVGVFNGDIGITLPDPERPQSQRVYFLDGNEVRSVLASRLSHVETAYAMTVHKVQGSEFGHAAMVLPADAGPVTARELIYTGITRAKHRFTLMTEAPAMLAKAIGQQTLRASGLRSLLGEVAAMPGEAYKKDADEVRNEVTDNTVAPPALELVDEGKVNSPPYIQLPLPL